MIVSPDDLCDRQGMPNLFVSIFFINFEQSATAVTLVQENQLKAFYYDFPAPSFPIAFFIEESMLLHSAPHVAAFISLR